MNFIVKDKNDSRSFRGKNTIFFWDGDRQMIIYTKEQVVDSIYIKLVYQMIN